MGALQIRRDQIPYTGPDNQNLQVVLWLFPVAECSVQKNSAKEEEPKIGNLKMIQLPRDEFLLEESSLQMQEKLITTLLRKDAVCIGWKALLLRPWNGKNALWLAIRELSASNEKLG